LRPAHHRTRDPGHDTRNPLWRAPPAGPRDGGATSAWRAQAPPQGRVTLGETRVTGVSLPDDAAVEAACAASVSVSVDRGVPRMLRGVSDVHRGGCGQLALADGAKGEARSGRGLGREGPTLALGPSERSARAIRTHAARCLDSRATIEETLQRANVAGSVESAERQERMESAERHTNASDAHSAAAGRHAAAALRWASMGDRARAEFERRSARLEKDAAELEDDRARYYRGRNL
jgi:hypothetical protein